MPLLVSGVVFGTTVLFALSMVYERSLSRELASRAELLTQAAEQTDVHSRGVTGLLSDLTLLGIGSPRLAATALVDLERSRVVAARQVDWADRAGGVAELDPLFQGRSSWWVDGYEQQAFALPVILPEIGRDLRLVMILDGSEIAGANKQNLLIVALAIVLCVLLLSLGAFVMVRRRVLEPVHEIRAAVARRREGDPNAQIPKSRDDEIGSLAELLERTLSEREQLDDSLRVMSHAIQGSSNEVYVIDAASMAVQFANKAAEDSLGYTRSELQTMVVADVARDMADPEYAAELARAIQPSNELRHCYTHTRKDGTEYPFEFTAMRVRQNQRVLLIVLGNDITIRRAHEAALKASEERLNLAVAGANEGIFDYDVSTDELYVSERVREWLVLPENSLETIEEQVFSAIHPEDLPVVRAAFQDCLDHGREFDVEFRYEPEGAQPRWLQVRGRSSWSDSDALSRVSGFVSDISRRKIAERLLQDSVARLGAVLDNIAEGIVTLNAEGLVCAINPACEKMLECDAETLVSQPFTERLEVRGGAWDLYAGRQVSECVGVRASGETFPAEFAVSTLGDGSDEHFIVVFRDISDRKAAEEQLRRALTETRAATQAKDEFLATMSHEIRTPMNGVLGMTQLLLDMQLTEEQQETAQVIYNSGEALLTIINDILDYSKIEAGKLVFESMPFDFRVAVGEVMDLLAGSKRDLDLYVDYPTDTPSHLLGDVGRIRQVLMNLVGNALKFTEHGHVVVRVADTVATEALPFGAALRSFAQLKVSVIDTGHGIDPDTQAQLFESFTQADASTTRRFGGTGLGLAICKRLVELMGGDIGLDSEEGRGSVFWFTLNLPTYLEDFAASLPAELEGKRVLVVDDNPVGQQIYQRALERAGVVVMVAGSAEAALATCEQHGAFDAAVLDYHMPVVDGLDLAEQMGELETCRDTRLVMLSSSDIRGAPALRRFDGFAVKPVLPDELYALLSNTLAVDRSPGPGLQAETTPSADRGSSRFRVLLAEDNVVNQKVAVRMLEKLGCRVDVAANGHEALEMWERFPYSIIFMDCQMPELDGLEATRQIRQLELLDGGHTPIVAMTANAMRGDEDDCLAAGMDDYLAKPVKTAQLADALQRWCATRRRLPNGRLQQPDA